MTISNQYGTKIIPGHLYKYTGYNPYIKKDIVFTYIEDFNGNVGRFASTDGTYRGTIMYKNVAPADVTSIPESNRQGVSLLYREEDTHA